MALSVPPSTSTPRVDDRLAAFEAACRDAWRPVMRLLLATLPPGAETEDVAAITFETAWRRRAELATLEDPVTWLQAVALNVARNERRRVARRWRLLDRLASAERPGRAAPGAGDTALAAMAGPATQALMQLGVDDRELLVLHAWNDLDVAELAEVLGIRPNTAAQRLRRARQRLQAALERGTDDPATEATP